MTGQELREARGILGERLGLSRAVRAAEIGRALGLRGDDPGESVRLWEKRGTMPGPPAEAIRGWIQITGLGEVPPSLEQAIGRRAPDAAEDPR